VIIAGDDFFSEIMLVEQKAKSQTEVGNFGNGLQQLT